MAPQFRSQPEIATSEVVHDSKDIALSPLCTTQVVLLRPPTVPSIAHGQIALNNFELGRIRHPRVTALIFILGIIHKPFHGNGIASMSAILIASSGSFYKQDAKGLDRNPIPHKPQPRRKLSQNSLLATISMSSFPQVIRI